MSRVLVIGSGMAGTAAALAARRAGAVVTVVAAGPGATAFSSGVAWGRGAAAAMDGFEAASGGSLSNVLGELATVAQAAPQQAHGVIRPGRGVGVVGIRGAPQLIDAGWVANGLRQASVTAESVDLDLYLTSGEAIRTPFEWAVALDRPEEQERWAQALARLPERCDLLLLPPFMGWEVRTFEALRAASKRELGELVATNPSVPGLRLHRALASRRAAAGCEERRADVTALDAGRARLASGKDLAFDGAVLATGRFVGGGVRHAGGVFTEPLLGLKLALGTEPSPAPGTDLQLLSGARPGVAAPLFDAGVLVDGSQHPLTTQGAPVAWLYAAGSIIAGRDQGLGFAWESGLTAGRLAAGVGSATRSAVA